MAASAVPSSSMRPSAFPSTCDSLNDSLVLLSQAPGTKSTESFGDMDWGNEDESFEVPKFHFDWGVTKDRSDSNFAEHSQKHATTVPPVVSRLPSSKGLVSSLRGAHSQTPPSSTLMSFPSSATSSQDPDQSTSSGSRRSPSYGSDLDLGGPTRLRQIRNVKNGQNNSSGSDTAGRSYGARTYKRVVSAPLAVMQAGIAQQDQVGVSRLVESMLTHRIRT
jgi:hypothetical protein